MMVSPSTPRVRVMAVTVVACVAAVAVTQRGWPGSAALGTAAALLGFILVSLAALGRAWTSVFIAGSKDAKLIQAGPYAACRHPLYALTLVGMLGLGLATRSATLTALLLGVAIVTHLRALRTEDATLVERHGDAARAYQASIPALVPRMSRYVVPETLQVQPRVLWKAFVDAGSLLLAYALITVAHLLQTSGATPALLRLP